MIVFAFVQKTLTFLEQLSAYKALRKVLKSFFASNDHLKRLLNSEIDVGFEER